MGTIDFPPRPGMLGGRCPWTANYARQYGRAWLEQWPPSKGLTQGGACLSRSPLPHSHTPGLAFSASDGPRLLQGSSPPRAAWLKTKAGTERDLYLQIWLFTLRSARPERVGFCSYERQQTKHTS